MSVDPVLKWAGGKRARASDVRWLIGRPLRYHEPFAGGLAVWASMVSDPRQCYLFPSEEWAGHAFLSDASAPLVSFYKTLRDHVEEVILHLEDLRSDYLGRFENDRASLYYETRSAFNVDASSSFFGPRQAARFLFLNKTGFNGLCRFNRRGEFNVPHGRYIQPKMFEVGHLRAFAAALRTRVMLRTIDFEEALADVRPGDGVYLDPPFVAGRDGVIFRSYTGGGWTRQDDDRVHRIFADLVRRGARVVLSQNDTPEARAAVENAGGTIALVSRPNAISCEGSKREAVGELLAWPADMGGVVWPPPWRMTCCRT